MSIDELYTKYGTLTLQSKIMQAQITQIEQQLLDFINKQSAEPQKEVDSN